MNLKKIWIIAALALILSPTALFAITQGKMQLAVPFPNPVKAGEIVTFQIVVLNAGNETWTVNRYFLYAEIYDEDHNYITKTDMLIGNVSVEPSETVLFYLPFKVPQDAFGKAYLYRVVLNYNDNRILYSDYLSFGIISTGPRQVGPPPVRLAGKGMISYKNGTLQNWQDYLMNFNLGIIGLAFENPVVFKFDTNYSMKGLKVNNILFNYRLPSVNISAGDVMPLFSSLVFSNMGIRGLFVESKGEKAEVAGVTALSAMAEQAKDTSPGVYERYVYGLRGGITPLKDFKVGLSCVYAYDNESSISNSGTGLTPAKNLVGATDISYMMLKKFLLEGEYAYSNYSSDFKTKPAGNDGNAYRISLSAMLEDLAVNVTFKNISTYFNSLNSPFSVSDRMGWEGLVNYNLNFLKTYFLYNRFKDNLLNDPLKVTTTIDNLSSLFTFTFSKLPIFTIGYGCSNFISDYPDLVNNSATNISTGLSHKINDSSISMGYQLSKFLDKTSLSPDLFNTSVNLRFTSMLFKKLSFNAGTSYSWLMDLDAPKTDESLGVSIGANYEFIPTKLTLSGFSSFSYRIDNVGTTDNLYSNISVETTYKITPKVLFMLGGEWINYIDSKNASNDYQNWRISTRAGYSF